MNKNEVIELLDFITINYPNFKIDESNFENTVNVWHDELQQYELDDVKKNLKEFMADDYYQKEPPKLSMLVKGLTKKHEKINWSEVETYCPRCHKPLSQSEYDEHFDRCSSIDYVIRESKKWLRKNLTRRFLWQMSKEEFEERYNKLLKYIMEHTTDERERTRIGFIFNPPSKEKAKQFLNERN